MTEQQPRLSNAEKQEALAAILGSFTLRRSEQLRRILTYICTEEIEGRGGDLTESSIAMHALGRATEYSPDTDSTVRTRTYELRRRLDEHYRSEGQQAPIRVELPKGTYRPSFVRAAAQVAEQTPEPQTEAVRTPPARRAFWLAAGVLAGCLATAGIASVLPRLSEMTTFLPPGEAALRQAWGPLLRRGSTVSVVVATPMQLWLRDFGDEGDPKLESSFLMKLPPDQQMLDWYKRLLFREPQNLRAQPNSHSPLWGDAAAAVAACRFLSRRGVEVELLPESAVRPAALKERNAVLIGRGDYSSIVELLLPTGGYFVRYSPDRKEVGVMDSKSGTGYFRERGGAVNYGVVTVVTTEGGPRGPFRYIIVSGINSDGSQAAMEFLGSPEKLTELKRRFAEGGHRDWPRSFQIVVQTISSETYTLRSQYAAHRIFD